MLGNYSAKREMATTDLASGDWRDLSAKMYAKLFADARFDVGNTTDLAIVPDGWLWYLPFEALVGAGVRSRRPCCSSGCRCIMGRRRRWRWAIGGRFVGAAHAASWRIDWAAEAASAGDDATHRAAGGRGAGAGATGAAAGAAGYLLAPLLDGLVVLDDVEVGRNDPYDWSPLPKSRGKGERLGDDVDGVAVRRSGADGVGRVSDGGGDVAAAAHGGAKRRRAGPARCSTPCAR